MKSKTDTNKLSSLQTIQLALQASATLDIPPRTRRVITIAGIAGVGLIAMASLVSRGQEQYVEIDKIVHFAGYFIVSFILVVGLRPLLFVPALLALISLGIGVEYLQVKTGRAFELLDALANTVGAGVGASLGLLARSVYSYVRTEIETAAIRKRLVNFGRGDTIYETGDPSAQFYVIKSGLVRLTRGTNGTEKEIAVLGPGEVIGEMGAIEGRPRSTTARAVLPTRLFGMDRGELIKKTDGKVDHPSLTVLRVLARRLRKANEELDRERSGA